MLLFVNFEQGWNDPRDEKWKTSEDGRSQYQDVGGERIYKPTKGKDGTYSSPSGCCGLCGRITCRGSCFK